MELQRKVPEDIATRLETELHYSNRWHQRLSMGYKSRSETSSENLGEL